MSDDSELLRLYADENSDEAFAELVRRHIGTVYAVAKRRVGGDAHLAEDVAQEVFTDLARKAAPLSRRKTLVGWIFVATRFASAKAVRRDQQRQSLWRKAQDMTEREFDSRNEPAWEEIRPVLDDAIHELNERDRDAVLLHFFDRKTFADIGSALSITESGARMRVERALDKLRLSLGRRGITSTTAALTFALSSQAVAAVPGTLVAAVTTAAMAGSAQSSGAVLLYLMSITKTQLSAAIIVVTAGATIGGVLQLREISRLRIERTAFYNESAANAGRANELAGKLAKDEEALAAAKTHLGAQIHAGISAAAQATAASPSTGANMIHMKDLLRDHPEMAALQQRELRRSIVREYGRAIAALNLSPDKAAQLKELLVEKAVTSSDAVDAATKAGLQPSSGDTYKAISQATRDLDQAINTLIGADADDKLEALKGTNFYGNGNEIDESALDMEDAGVPLSAEQAQALAQFLHDLSSPAKNPDSGAPGFKNADPITWQSPLDQQLFAKASTVLTPSQLQILKTSRSESNQREAIINQYRSSSDEAVIIMN